MERLLHRMQRPAILGQALDRRHVVALGLHSQHQARPDGRAIEKDRAAAAHTVLATDMRPGQPEPMAEVVREEAARVAGGWMLDPVDLHAAKAFSVRTRTRWRRKSGDASTSALGSRSRSGSRGSASTGVDATPNSASLVPARTTPASAKSP